MNVLNYARQVNPTYANFNIVTPYPGTEFFLEAKNRGSGIRFFKIHGLSPGHAIRKPDGRRGQRLHGRCFAKFYFRSGISKTTVACCFRHWHGLPPRQPPKTPEPGLGWNHTGTQIISRMTKANLILILEDQPGRIAPPLARSAQPPSMPSNSERTVSRLTLIRTTLWSLSRMIA